VTIGTPSAKQLSLTREELWPETIIPNDDMGIPIVWIEAQQEGGISIIYAKQLTAGGLKLFSLHPVGCCGYTNLRPSGGPRGSFVET
jgi:hypothetical protein